MEKMTIEELINLFVDKTGCNIQHNGSPCNSCFHNIEANFQHICWLMLLGLRGDYDKKEIIKAIKEELHLKEYGTT